MNFRVGMPVKCINAGMGDIDASGILVEGAEYLVKEIERFGGRTYLHLVGVFMGWRSSRFRPAVSPKSETSFTQGAPLDSEQWDNRRLPARVKEWGASA